MSEDEKFDLALREKLKDAEVKAPSGVWKAVSSRLDDIEGVAAAGSGDPSRLWLWLGSGLALASLALALVLTGTIGKKVPERQLASLVEPAPHPESPFIDIVSDATVAQSYSDKAPEYIDAVSDRECPDRAPEIEVDRTAPSLHESEGSEIPSAALVPEVSGKTADPNPEEPAAQVTEHSVPEEPAAVPSIRDDGFVALETEKKSKGGFGSYVSGTVSGNSGINRQTSYTSGSSDISASDYIQETGSSVYGIPFSVGVGARYHFNRKLSVSAGVDYSLLTRSFSGKYLPNGASSALQGDAYHYVHYLGIPVNVYYNFLETSILRFYGFAGGEIEFCLASKYRFRTAAEDYYLSEKVTNPLFSVRMGVGIEFKVSELVGIYLDPGAYYCFYSQQPKSLRTERPFNFNFNAGVRFNF